jgi:transposase
VPIQRNKKSSKGILKKIIKKNIKNNPSAILLAEDEAALMSVPSIIRTWGKKGIQPVIPTSNKKRFRATMFGAVNLYTGDICSAIAETGNTETFLSFVRKVLKKYPRKEIFFVLDNVRFHHAKKVTEIFLKRVKRLHFIYLPSYSPDLNPQEWVWKQLRRETTHNTYYEIFDDEIKAAKEFLQRYKLPVKKLLCKII